MLPPTLLPSDRDTLQARPLRACLWSGCMLPLVCNRQKTALQVMYNRAAQFWHALYNIFSQYKLIKGRKWMHFFGTQQRFFRQMLMAAKVGVTRTSCHCGWSVVILTNICACLPTPCTQEWKQDRSTKGWKVLARTISRGAHEVY